MSLIAKQPKIEYQAFTVRMPANEVAELKLYCKFIGGSIHYVIGGAVNLLTTKDKDYLRWKKEQRIEGETVVP